MIDRPVVSADNLTLGDIIDIQAVQLVMNTFYLLTKSGNAILDMQGNVLVATGWQDICMKFHRKHPETCKNCRESDVQLASGIEPGKFKLKRCKNGLWDIATPIVVEGRQVGNLYLGQFLFDDETVDYKAFRAAAHRYGFDEAEYIASLDRAPRMNRETVNHAMEFCVQFAKLISMMGFNAVKLERKVTTQTRELTALNEELAAQLEEISVLNRTLANLNERLEQRVAERTADLVSANEELIAQYDELKQAEEELRNTDDHLSKLIQYASAPIIVWNPGFTITRFNRAFEQLSGYARAEVVGGPLSVLFPPDQLSRITALIEQSRSGERWESVEIPIRCKTGEERITLWNSANIYAADAVTLTAVIAQGQDITERVRREREAVQNEQTAQMIQNALLTSPEATEYLDVSLLFKPLEFVGGDLYFLDWRYESSLLRGFLVDTTGHGLATALHTASVHVLLREVNEQDLPLAEAMRWINRRVGAYFAEGVYAGALGFELDLATRQLRWVCAGLPEFWLASQLVTGTVQSPGLFLGIHECEGFDVHSLPMSVGDCFYFLTDGFSDLLQKRSDLPLNRFSQMLELLEDLSVSRKCRDDATAICIKVCALPQTSARRDGWPRTIHFNGYGDYQRLKGEIGRILAEITGREHSRQEVAVHEALANAMECRDGVSRQHKASVRFNRVGNRLIVRVKTSRLAFAGNAMLRRLRSQPEEMFAFGEDASMGRGIPMMICLAEKMTYNSEGTELLLAWRF